MANFKVDHPAPEAITSPVSFFFKLFKQRNGLVPAAGPFCKLFRAGNVEPRPWALPREAWPSEDVAELDCTRCYPSFISPRASSYPYYERYGIPVNGRRWLKCGVNSAPTPDHLALTGFATLSAWSLANDVHPAIAVPLSAHLTRRDDKGAPVPPVLPTPLLAFCLSAGIFARCEVSEILYAVDVSKNLSFDPVSEDKGLTNKLIGFCVRDDRQTDVLVFDKNEAAAVRRTMIEDVNCKVDANEYGDAVHLRYAESCERASYPHVRGFILGYAAIQLFAKVCEVKAVTTIYKTVCDALFVDKEADKKYATVAKNEFPAWGDWRVKRTFNIDEDKITLHVYEDNEIARGAEGCAPASTAPALSLSPLRRHGLSFLVGQGGSGKTHRAILDTFSAGLKTLYLAPTNRLCREKGKEFPNLAVSTYHKYFKVSMKGEFNPTQMETAKRYQVLVMDEACYLSREFLEPLVVYCERAGVVVIACGDPGQLHPIDGAPPADWLRSRAGYYEEVLTDFRSRCDQLRALKARMHMQDDVTQIREMRAALPSVRVNEMFAQCWRPGDLIIGATNRRNEVINNRIFRDYAKKASGRNRSIRLGSDHVFQGRPDGCTAGRRRARGGRKG